MIDPELLKYATAKQAEKIQALIDTGSQRKAAKVIGCVQSSIARALKAVRKKAAARGHSPEHSMTNTVPDGYSVKGVSTLYDDEGNIKVQWVKSQANRERQEELLRIVAQTLADDVRGKSTFVKAPKIFDKDLLACYPTPEPHNGMFAWNKETDGSYDCKISYGVLDKVMDELVESAPPAETALVSSIGDLTHIDNSSNETTASGNKQDVDTRFTKVFLSSITLVKMLIEKALAKHKHVIVKGVGGNHDEETSFAIAVVLDAFYNNNDRVTVDLSPRCFKYHRWGNCLIGIYHGHKVKGDALPLLMATDKREDWGETVFRYWLTGHIHHLTRKEFPGCVVETFRSTAAHDKWHFESGYRALRDAQCIVYHKEFGEWMRITRPVVEKI